MAESTLTLEYDNIASDISFMLYGENDYTNLTSTQQSDIGDIMDRGYMQFLYPPALEGVEAGYEWTFMKPWATINTIASYSTGTVEVSSNTCTITGGTWPSWTATHGILSIAGTEVTIVSRNSGSELTLTGADDVSSGEEDWVLEHDGDYDLPDDFDRLINGYYFDRDTQKPAVLGGVSEGKIRRLRSSNDTTDYPRIAAEVIKPSDSTTSQRREVQLWPRTNTAYTLHYKYAVYVGEFNSGEYPSGSLKFSDTLRESCLATAEIRMNDERGVHWESFVSKLISSIKRDRRQQDVYMGNVGRLGDEKWHGDTVTNYTLTVGGTVIQE